MSLFCCSASASVRYGRGCGHSGSGRATLRFLGRDLCFVPAPQSEDDLRLGPVSFQGYRHSPSPGQPEDVYILMDEAWQPTEWSFWELSLGRHNLLQSKTAPELRRSEGHVLDLLCGWQIRLQSANPRENHTLRTVPPSLCAEYGRLHDAGVWSSAAALGNSVKLKMQFRMPREWRVS